MIIDIPAFAFHAAQKCRAVNDLRTQLNGVYLRADGAVCGSDGHRAAITKNCGDFTDLPHRLIDFKEQLPVKCEWVRLDMDKLTATMLDRQMVEIKAVLYKTDMVRYPDLDRAVAHTDEAVKAIGLDPSLVSDLATIFRGCKGVVLTFRGAMGSVKVTSPSRPDTAVYVMPCRL